MPRLHGHTSVALAIGVVLLAGCTRGTNAAATAPSSPTTAAAGSAKPGLGGQGTPPGASDGAAKTSAAAEPTGPVGDLEAVLRLDPAKPRARKRLRATALDATLEARVRYAALHALELAPPVSDTLAVAIALAELGAADEERRFLSQNAIAVLVRLDTPEARAAVDRLGGATAAALAAAGKGR